MPGVKITNTIKLDTNIELNKMVEAICSCSNLDYVVDLNKIIPEPYCLTQLIKFDDDEIFALAANAISDMLDIEGRPLTDKEVREAMGKWKTKNKSTREVFIERVIEGSSNYGPISDLYKEHSYFYVFSTSLLALYALADAGVVHEYYWRRAEWGFTTEKPKAIINKELKEITWVADGWLHDKIRNRIKEKTDIDFKYFTK